MTISKAIKGEWVNTSGISRPDMLLKRSIEMKRWFKKYYDISLEKQVFYAAISTLDEFDLFHFNSGQLAKYLCTYLSI